MKNLIINQIDYQGRGSDKQVEWAKKIIADGVRKVNEEYQYAHQRVERGTMPQAWADIWDEIMGSLIPEMVEKLSSAPASRIIERRQEITGIAAKAFRIAKNKYESTSN